MQLASMQAVASFKSSLLCHRSEAFCMKERGDGTVSVMAEESGQGFLLASGNMSPFGGWSLHARSSSGNMSGI